MRGQVRPGRQKEWRWSETRWKMTGATCGESVSNGTLDTYEYHLVIVQVGRGRVGLPTVPPLAEALAVEGV
jgi:hypothetical protein